jgi:ketosteroid isomerase-like protein
MIKQLIFVFLLLMACTTGSDKARIERAKKEIVQTEQAFEAMAKEKGLSEAFAYYADSAAALNRGSYVIHGKDSIRLFYLAPRFKGVKLEWKPDFVEVSKSADLGYTYGKYTFSTQDSTGTVTSSRGIFHTVWKKQANGEWRFVWD